MSFEKGRIRGSRSKSNSFNSRKYPGRCSKKAGSEERMYKQTSWWEQFISKKYHSLSPKVFPFDSIGTEQYVSEDDGSLNKNWISQDNDECSLAPTVSSLDVENIISMKNELQSAVSEFSIMLSNVNRYKYCCKIAGCKKKFTSPEELSCHVTTSHSSKKKRSCILNSVWK